MFEQPNKKVLENVAESGIDLVEMGVEVAVEVAEITTEAVVDTLVDGAVEVGKGAIEIIAEIIAS